MHRRTAIGVITGTGLTALTGSNVDRNDEQVTGPSSPPSDLSRGDSDTAAERDDDTAESDVSFELAPYELSRCGTTCGEATTTVTHTGNTDATGVHVTVQLSADGALLWETDETIDQFEAGASITRTERVDLGFSDLLAVRENDGRVTITTVIESDQQTERIVREKEM
ncbi:hypothetical protein [Halostagnicola bangensis]